jgi:N-acetylmuramoyl-L-alanine amidase
MAKVFLSAGHGGSDPGAVSHGIKEADVNLQALLECKNVLEKHGVTVICSRTTDENDPVGQEVKEANASGADLAVSFHANAAGGDGFEAFYHASSTKGKKLAQLGEKYVKQLGQNSRGIKSGNKLYFIKNTKMTAVLFESFFVDNDTDNNIGDTVAEQRAFGEAYGKAILEYLGVGYDSIPPVKTNPLQPYLVRITANSLNVRKVPNGTVVTSVKKGQVYTITEVRNGWGKLKSGIGWISLNYTQRV